jgi:transcriptional regulator with XRE-family HTH domain
MDNSGIIIRHLRRLNGLSLQGLSEKIGRSIGWLSEIENDSGESRLTEAEFDREPVDLNKSDVANYIFCNLGRLLDDFDVKTLRNLHFDERKVLTSLAKNASEENQIPEPLRKALRELYGLTEPTAIGISERPKKRPVPRRMESSSRKDSMTDSQAVSNDPVEVMNSTESQARRITERS